VIMILLSFGVTSSTQQNHVTGRMVYRMFILGHNSVSGLLCTFNP